MLLIKDGRFYAQGVSFQLPDGVYVETDPGTPHEQGFTVWEKNHEVLMDIYIDEEDDPLGSLQKILEDDDSSFIPYSPISKLVLNGMNGYEVSYHDKNVDYYECRLVVSEDIAVTFFAQYEKGSIKKPKEFPAIKELLESIRLEEQSKR